MKDSGVINEKNLNDSKVALVYGQMNEPPGARMRVSLTALTMAEYFRDGIFNTQNRVGTRCYEGNIQSSRQRRFGIKNYFNCCFI